MLPKSQMSQIGLLLSSLFNVVCLFCSVLFRIFLELEMVNKAEEHLVGFRSRVLDRLRSNLAHSFMGFVVGYCMAGLVEFQGLSGEKQYSSLRWCVFCRRFKD